MRDQRVISTTFHWWLTKQIKSTTSCLISTKKVNIWVESLTLLLGKWGTFTFCMPNQWLFSTLVSCSALPNFRLTIFVLSEALDCRCLRMRCLKSPNRLVNRTRHSSLHSRVLRSLVIESNHSFFSPMSNLKGWIRMKRVETLLLSQVKSYTSTVASCLEKAMSSGRKVAAMQASLLPLKDSTVNRMQLRVLSPMRPPKMAKISSTLNADRLSSGLDNRQKIVLIRLAGIQPSLILISMATTYLSCSKRILSWLSIWSMPKMMTILRLSLKNQSSRGLIRMPLRVLVNYSSSLITP